MNVNKKIGRFKQWAGERMGGEVKTNASDDFKALEVEMGLRHEGMEKMQRSMNSYVKSISKKTDVEDKDKSLPIAYLGATMIHHGEDFELNSEFGQCLTMFGKTQERLARVQENYIADATGTWLESLERSLVQMKEYQAARKKLETRRLAYDASLAKMQKAKKEDFRVEEELRSQRAKYEESNDEVYRRMQDIKEAETESVTDLSAFLDAELAYHDNCREALLQLRREWPGRSESQPKGTRSNPRSRSNTGGLSHSTKYNAAEEESAIPMDRRPTIKASRTPSYKMAELPASDYDEIVRNRPNFARSTTFEGPTQLRREVSPISIPRMSRIPSDCLTIRTAKSQLRSVEQAVPEHDVFNEQDDSPFDSTSSPDQSHGGRSVSPATSHGSLVNLTHASPAASKKGPPPPPPSRAKKPPPPPLPVKRNMMV